VKLQPVAIGYQDSGTAVVTKGLQANQTVVVAGQSRLSSGTRVAASAANASDRHG
jgi:hypothetical protein